MTLYAHLTAGKLMDKKLPYVIQDTKVMLRRTKNLISITNELSSGDETIKLWDLQSGEELCTLYSFNDGDAVIMTLDGYFDASSKECAHKNINMRLLTPLGAKEINDEAYNRYHRPYILRERVQSVKQFDYKASIMDEIVTMDMDEDEIPF